MSLAAQIARIERQALALAVAATGLTARAGSEGEALARAAAELLAAARTLRAAAAQTTN